MFGGLILWMTLIGATTRMFLYIPQFLSLSDHRHLLDELSRVQLVDENNQVAPGRLRTFMSPETVMSPPRTLRERLARAAVTDEFVEDDE